MYGNRTDGTFSAVYCSVNPVVFCAAFLFPSNNLGQHARDNILNTFLYYIDGAFIDAVEKKVADEKIIGFIVGKALMLR